MKHTCICIHASYIPGRKIATIIQRPWCYLGCWSCHCYLNLWFSTGGTRTSRHAEPCCQKALVAVCLCHIALHSRRWYWVRAILTWSGLFCAILCRFHRTELFVQPVTVHTFSISGSNCGSVCSFSSNETGCYIHICDRSNRFHALPVLGGIVCLVLATEEMEEIDWCVGAAHPFTQLLPHFHHHRQKPFILLAEYTKFDTWIIVLTYSCIFSVQSNIEISSKPVHKKYDESWDVMPHTGCWYNIFENQQDLLWELLPWIIYSLAA